MTEAASRSPKPVVATFMSVEGAIPMLAPIPCYRFPEAAVGALARAVRYGAWQRTPAEKAPDCVDGVRRARVVLSEALSRGPGWLTASEAQDVLTCMGIAVVPSRGVTTEDGAVEVAGTLGYPVALKGLGP